MDNQDDHNDCSSEWDAYAGVWVGNKASNNNCDLPSPLYLFGYGSLLWRPGPILEDLLAYDCACKGWKRMFLQRSLDHRGNSAFPGLVVTLVGDSYLDSIGHSYDMDECKGRVWIVPDHLAQDLLEELDFREKGGYHRSYLKVCLIADTPFHAKGTMVDAIAYIGSTSNPNFVVPSKLPFGRNHIDIIATAIGPSGRNCEYLYNLVRYLFRNDLLDSALLLLAYKVIRRQGHWQYSDLLQQPHGDWLRHVATQQAMSSLRPPCVRHSSSSGSGDCHGLYGWGSNEYCQLQPTVTALQHTIAGTDPLHSLPHCTVIHMPSDCVCDDMRAGQTVISESVVCGAGTSALLQCIVQSSSSSISSSSISSSSKSSSSISSSSISSSLLHRVLLWGQLPSALVTALGLPAATCHPTVVIDGVTGLAIGPTHLLLTVAPGQVFAIGENAHYQCSGMGSRVPVFRRLSVGLRHYVLEPQSLAAAADCVVVKVAAGLRHSVALTREGDLLSWGSNTFGQSLRNAASVSSSCVMPSTSASSSSSTSSSSTIAGDGKDDWGRWSSPSGPQQRVRVTDVSCGSRHTICLDDLGRVWTFGDNRYGTLGRPLTTVSGHQLEIIDSTHKRPVRAVDSTPGQVQGLPEGVKWQRVVSGWAHVAVRGTRPDGSSAIYMWGRNDMAQCGCLSLSPSDDDDNAHCQRPVQVLLPLSLSLSGEHDRSAEGGASDSSSSGGLCEVWCGAECSLVVQHTGALWSTGWGDHNSLGHSSINNNNNNNVNNNNNDNNNYSGKHSTWRPVTHSNQQQVVLCSCNNNSGGIDNIGAVFSEGNLAAGGAHGLCLNASACR